MFLILLFRTRNTVFLMVFLDLLARVRNTRVLTGPPWPPNPHA